MHLHFTFQLCNAQLLSLSTPHARLELLERSFFFFHLSAFLIGLFKCKVTAVSAPKEQTGLNLIHLLYIFNVFNFDAS